MLTINDLLGNWRGIYAAGTGNEEANFVHTYARVYISGANLIVELYQGINTEVVPFVITAAGRNTPSVQVVPLSIVTVKDNVFYLLDYAWATIDDCGHFINFNIPFERIEEPPASLKAYFSVDWTDATALVNYYYTTMFEKNYGNIFGFKQDCDTFEIVENNSFKVCPATADNIRRLLLNGVGYYKEKTVHTFYRTKFSPDRPLTTVLFEGANPFNPSNIVTISGLKSDWSIVNGQYNISTIFGDQRFPHNLTDTSTASSYIYIIYDSSALPEYDSSIHGLATVRSIQEPITKSSNYRPLVSALADLLREAGPYTHNLLRAWSVATAGISSVYNRRVAANYTELQTAFDANTTSLVNVQGLIRGLHIAPFYNGIFFADSWNLNNKYSIPPSANYLVPLNYLAPGTLARAWYRSALPGVPLANILATAQATLGLLDLPKFFGVERLFEFAVSPTTPPLGSNPQPWFIHGDTTIFSFGLINQSLTSGKRIGYFRFGSSFDPFNSLALPGLALNFNVFLLAAQFYAEVGRYFKHTLNVDSVIVDSRRNSGGSDASTAAFGSLFGGDREVLLSYYKQIGAECSAITKQSDILRGTALEGISPTQNFWNMSQRPSVVEANFGDVILKDMPIYLLISVYSSSGGQLIIPMLLGECLDGNIGNNTFTRVIGDFYPYNAMNGQRSLPAPINQAGPNYITPVNNSSNNTPFEFTYEYGNRFWLKHQDISTSEFLRSYSPDLILSRDYNVLYKDLGYEPNECPYLLPGIPIPNVNTTWKDSWLESVLRLSNM